MSFCRRHASWLVGRWRQACLLGFIIVLLDVGPACGQQPLNWRGCGVSKTAFMEACAKAYEKQTGVSIRLSGGGAALGIEAAGTGGSDMGGTCRHCLVTNNEEWPELKLVVVAWDALVPIVHPNNPVSDISCEQLKQVFHQNITDWKELGGPDMPIVVTARRGQTSGVGHCVRLLILGDVDAKFGPTVVRLNSSGPVEKLVQQQPRAIAITGVSSAKKRKVKILSVDGIPATVANIGTGKYPFFRPLYLAYQPNQNPQADKFVEWILGPMGQQVIEDQGTVSLRQAQGLTELFAHNLPAARDTSKTKLEPNAAAEVAN